jgi:hypothetical protein
MTEEDLKHIEHTANALASWGMPTQADMMRALIAEVRRSQTGIIPLSVEQSVEFAKALVRAHGTPPKSVPERFMTPPEQPYTLSCSVTPAEKTELIADLQRAPAGELVQFWDMHNGILGLGIKTKSARNEVEPQHVVEGK